MGRGRGTEKKNTGGIIGRGYTILSLLRSLSFFLQRRPFNERNLLFAGGGSARALATRRRSAYDSRPGLSFSHFLFQSLCTYIYTSRLLSLSLGLFSVSLSTIRFHERDARVACILRAVDFAVSRVKDNQPPLCTTPRLLLGLLAHGVLSRRDARPKGIGRRARRAGNSNSSRFLFIFCLELIGCIYIYVYISTLRLTL